MTKKTFPVYAIVISMDPAEPPPYSLYLLSLILLILGSAFFSAAETAFFSASKLHLRYLREKKDKKAQRVEAILKKKSFFLTTILVGNNIINILTSALITSVCITLFGNAGVGIATASATILILIFGEILPKSVALHWPEILALHFALPLRLLMIVLFPIVFILTCVNTFLLFFTGTKQHSTEAAVTEDDIKNLIEIGEEEGVIETTERKMFHKILRYNDLCARDIMTPRTSISSIPINATRSDILELAQSSRFSHFPVYGENIDDILGFFHIKDFLLLNTTQNEFFTLSESIHPATIIFESHPISLIQQKLRNENQNIALVIDEYGGTAGLVTNEDIVEEVFGGIQDEFDFETLVREPIATDIENDAFRIEGSVRLDDINESLSISLESQFYDTIAGFIMEKTGEIPKEGVVICEQGYCFTVSQTVGHKIIWVTIKKELVQ